MIDLETIARNSLLNPYAACEPIRVRLKDSVLHLPSIRPAVMTTSMIKEAVGVTSGAVTLPSELELIGASSIYPELAIATEEGENAHDREHHNGSMEIINFDSLRSMIRYTVGKAHTKGVATVGVLGKYGIKLKRRIITSDSVNAVGLKVYNKPNGNHNQVIESLIDQGANDTMVINGMCVIPDDLDIDRAMHFTIISNMGVWNTGVNPKTIRQIVEKNTNSAPAFTTFDALKYDLVIPRDGFMQVHFLRVDKDVNYQAGVMVPFQPSNVHELQSVQDKFISSFVALGGIPNRNFFNRIPRETWSTLQQKYLS